MLAYSLNQIEQTSRKAVRGAGLGWGLAEDAGRAIRWLEMVGLPGVSSLAVLLSDYDHEQLSGSFVKDHGTHWSASPGFNSPLLIGPNINDWIHGFAQGNRKPERLNAGPMLEIRQGPGAMVYLGFVGAAARGNSSVSLKGEYIHAWLKRQTVMIQKGVSWQHLAAGQDLFIAIHFDRETPSIRTAQADTYTARIGARPVEQAAWHTLETYACRTYVEATEASRLAGAGAGLSDND